MFLKQRIIMAGVLAAASLAPQAFAQTAPPAPSTTPQGTSSTQGTTDQQGSQATSSQGGSNSVTDQNAVKEHLAGARTALAELTKLPAAAQLQGDPRTMVATFISDFNAFATATSDWRSKYEKVDESLNKLLALPPAETPATPPATTTAPAGATTTGAAPSAAGLDPTILAKLQEVRQHLDAFEIASGDPVFMVEAIEKVLNGPNGAAASGGSVTLDAAQVQDIKRNLERIRAAATK